MIKTGLSWSLAFLAVMFGMSIYAWNILPDGVQVPIHWNFKGEVDGYGGKLQALLTVPCIAVLLTAFLLFLPKIDPRKANLEKSSTAYLVGWIGTLGLLTATHILVIHTALGGEAPVAKLICIFVGMLFIGLGNYVTKTRSNWFVGLRTPWNLSSEHAWSVSNRMAGKGLVLTGILTVFAALFATPAFAYAALGIGSIASMIVSVIASYHAWKNDPDRKQTGL